MLAVVIICILIVIIVLYKVDRNRAKFTLPNWETPYPQNRWPNWAKEPPCINELGDAAYPSCDKYFDNSYMIGRWDKCIDTSAGCPLIVYGKDAVRVSNSL